MTLTGLRDQLDKYSMTTALDYLNTNLQNEGAIRRLLGMNATFNEVRHPSCLHSALLTDARQSASVC